MTGRSKLEGIKSTSPTTTQFFPTDVRSFEGIKSLKTIDSLFESLRSDETKLKCSFVELISKFLEEKICSRKCFRPLPPKLGNGCWVDLLKLYFVVKLKGGFNSISREKLWGEVGLLCGVGSEFGSGLKLVYLKYLDSFESWLVKLPSRESSKGVLMALETEYRSFVSNIMAEMRKGDVSCFVKEEKSGISFVDLTGEDNVNEKGDWNKIVVSSGDEGDSTEENEGSTKLKAEAEMIFSDGVGYSGENHDGGNVKQTKSEMSYVGVVSSNASDDGRSSVGAIVGDNVVKSSENSYESEKCLNEDEELIVDSSLMKEVSSLKRKRDGLSGMLEWMFKVAKDPIDPEIGSIPESYYWAACRNDNCWKQVLLAREALFMRKNLDKSTYQKKQKMHPSMFDDDLGCSERPRPSSRNYFEKSGNPNSFDPSNLERSRPRLLVRLDMQPTASIYTSRPYQRIPIGIDFQVDVPEWTGVVTESDTKWSGTRVWPSEKRENNLLIKQHTIGKGRSDPCGCMYPGTTECVKFHVSRRRMNLKYELASAFYAWKFDKMGEECGVSWTSEEENTFKLVVKENPFSHQKRFWKRMCEALPRKSWAEQVNYYYNVFVLQRRAFQNRFTPKNIDSDDDETEYGLATNTLRHCTESCASISSSKLAR